jgi:hypothetical protein
MSGPTQHPASNSDARKRQAERDHQAHPDPAVRELLAGAWNQGYAEGAIAMAGLEAKDNPYRSAS